jgi:VanZ family protein
VLVWRALQVLRDRRFLEWTGTQALKVLGLVTLCAASDELLQTFVPRRYGTPWDVVIDVSGATLALLLVFALSALHRGQTSTFKPAQGTDQK